jgi:hypothetical protein
MTATRSTNRAAIREHFMFDRRLRLSQRPAARAALVLLALALCLLRKNLRANPLCTDESGAVGSHTDCH